MARAAHVVGEAIDVWGDGWSVRERRNTIHGFDVLLGWPNNQARGRGGSGGVRVIVTDALAAHFLANRMAPMGLALPIGATAIKRIRRLLGHHRYIDRTTWWDERALDLCTMTLDAFCARHGVSVSAASHVRSALIGPTLRPANWWREDAIQRVLLSNRSTSQIADDLGIAASTVRKLRGKTPCER